MKRRMKMAKFEISNIKYDTQETEGLPSTLVAELADNLSEEEVEHQLSEWISDKTNFCHNGFDSELKV
jgi:hypothetical protein